MENPKWELWKSVLSEAKQETPPKVDFDKSINPLTIHAIVAVVCGILLLIIQPPFVTKRPGTKYETPSLCTKKVIAWMIVIFGVSFGLEYYKEKNSKQKIISQTGQPC